MKKLFSFIVLILLGWFTYTWFADQSQYREALRVRGDKNSVETVVIPKVASLATIAQLLETEGYVERASYFERYVEESGKARNLMAGSFPLSHGDTLPEIVEVLTGKAAPREMTIVIPEGMTIRAIDALLAQKELITEGELIACAKECTFSYDFLPSSGSLEGYVFPDTYKVFPHEFTPERFLRMTLDNFDRRVTKDMRARAQAQGHTLDEVVIMASLLEKESRPRDDRGIVSGILWKRLEVGMTLGVDATSLYEKEDPSDPLTYEDFQKDSPYNTRKHQGLPPTAIANPGLDTLEAALNPKESPYFYYLHDSKGQIYYGATLEEHNRNKAQYLR